MVRNILTPTMIGKIMVPSVEHGWSLNTFNRNISFDKYLWKYLNILK